MVGKSPRQPSNSGSWIICSCSLREEQIRECKSTDINLNKMSISLFLHRFHVLLLPVSIQNFTRNHRPTRQGHLMRSYQMYRWQVFCRGVNVLGQAHPHSRSYQEEELVYVVFSASSLSSVQTIIRKKGVHHLIMRHNSRKWYRFKY